MHVHASYIDKVTPAHLADICENLTFRSKYFVHSLRAPVEDCGNWLKMLNSCMYNNMCRDVLGNKIKDLCGRKCVCCSRHTHLQLAHGILDRPTLAEIALKHTPVVDGMKDFSVTNKIFIMLHIFSPPVAMCESCHRQWDGEVKDTLAVHVSNDIVHQIDAYFMWKDVGDMDAGEAQRILEAIPATPTPPKTKTLRAAPKAVGIIKDMLKTGKVDLKRRTTVKRAWSAMHLSPIRHAMKRGGFKLVGRQLTFGVHDELRGQLLDPYSPTSITTHLTAVEKYPQSKTQGNGYFHAALKTLLLVHKSLN